MRSSVRLASGEGFVLWEVACPGDHPRWSPPEQSGGHGLVLVRSGLFRLRGRGVDAVVDPSTAYLQRPGAELRFAHPDGGDTCTSAGISPELWHGAAGDAPAGLTVPVDGRTHVAHLALLRAAADGEVGYAAAETLLGLLHRLLREARVRAGQAAPGGAVPGPHVAARLVAAAQEAILADDVAARGLLPLAARLGVSPYRLSRVFRSHTGRSVTSYRNRVRVTRALDRLDAGETNLARLAADLGFADQAHLTRTVKAEVGHPPGVIRRLLNGSVAAPTAATRRPPAPPARAPGGRAAAGRARVDGAGGPPGGEPPGRLGR